MAFVKKHDLCNNTVYLDLWFDKGVCRLYSIVVCSIVEVFIVLFQRKLGHGALTAASCADVECESQLL